MIELYDFFSRDEAKNLKEKDLLAEITGKIDPNSSQFFDLVFHAAFAKRIFDIIRREGPQVQGFERMQQSFTESVEKIKRILAPYETADSAGSLLSSTPEARSKLSRLIEDLALLKNWLLSHEKR
jgi:hypothetical protein